jgi:hypothetical protein
MRLGRVLLQQIKLVRIGTHNLIQLKPNKNADILISTFLLVDLSFKVKLGMAEIE